MKKAVSKAKASRKPKTKISKLGDKVAKTSIDAISNIENQPGKNKRKINKANRQVYGIISLVAITVIGIILMSNLWPINRFTSDSNQSGGTYIEGSVSSFGNLNPIFASENAEKAIGKLIFSSLFKFDENGELTGDLAESWSVNEDNTIFTVKLKSDIRWSDDQDVNADDVVKTYELIQHPDAESPSRNSWRGVKVSKVDDLTVTFALANNYSPFYKSLVNPIIPEHVFEGLPASEIRLSDFSQQPLINSGPFIFKRINENTNQVELIRNKKYHGEKPGIEEFIIKAFDSTQEMLSSYRAGQISAMANVDLNDITNNGELRSVFESDNSFNMPLHTSTFLFLKNDNDIFKDLKVRKAVSRGIDTEKIGQDSYGLIYPLNSPLLPSQHEISTDTPQETYNVDEANKLLDEAGWKVDSSTGIRMKDKVQLKFDINVQNSGIFPVVAQEVAKQLFDIGILATVQEVRPSTLQQNHIIPHSYDSVIFGFEGNNDPDVFALWHSSQAGVGGFNLSEINDQIIDETLEAGRTRTDQTLRDKNYEAFLEQWHSRVPAVPLYRPNYIYVSKNNIKGIKTVSLNVPEDRFNQIADWYIK